ncbi:O-succinylhomoserine sulfhydrylase [Thermoflavifilum aggregans]|uniref:O-succinylhomoserine sulfhydrylase n=1 Tax=Thermoflavifilum aggregans TaxID=454188 RepID=A0A2M9CTV9_9BACT|nr:aminotransferase class I/II-fold pyridoxal phosphate-dependent enzyme [Thermoflavifilum aggregans]PJJ75362.1 O-succinylhomoserine sulfhydrylase [Thermoflavifilum aggregans]
MSDQQQWHPQTRTIRIQHPATDAREHSVPLFLTSSFCYPDAETMRAVFADEQEAYIYSRFSNPNVDEFVQRMCALEEAESGFATASGMSAVFASVMAFLKQGDHLLSSAAIFGSTHTLFSKYLPKWGISYDEFDIRHPEQLEKLIRPETRMIFLETPSNPGLDLVDIEQIARMAHAHGLLLNVDNCFATPILQKPLLLGADLVVHSATKWIDGQGRVLGGIVLGKKELIQEVYLLCRTMGPSLSPFNAWILSRSLETLHLRMMQHSANALELARRLQQHPVFRNQPEKVKYPFLETHPQYAIARKQMSAGGGIVCFELPGGLEQGQRFLDALQMLSLTANLGDTRSIASHPASTTHAKLTEEERLAVGITPGLIRISVGLEHVDDIYADIEQALRKSAG